MEKQCDACGVILTRGGNRTKFCLPCLNIRKKEQGALSGLLFRARKAGREPDLVEETSCTSCGMPITPSHRKKFCGGCKHKRDREGMRIAAQKWRERQTSDLPAPKAKRMKRYHLNDMACDSGYF